MNLGDVYLKTVLLISGVSFCVCLAGAIVWRLWREVPWRVVWLTTFCAGCVVAPTANSFLHRRVFISWHRGQNEYVPKTGCVTYEPSFFRLYASYRMDRETFDDWVANHPWRLLPFDGEVPSYDGQRLGFESPDVALATEMAPNGRQLRVYFKDGMMYLSYYVM
jgi:hypothetical protein